MADFHAIYRDRADDYDLLVSREDHQGNLLRTIEARVPLAGRDVVEFGAGTGRMTRLLAPRVRSIRAFDASEAMIAVARRRMDPAAPRNWSFDVGRNEALPCGDASADVVVAGWTFGHLTGWHPKDWREHVARVFAEMRRVARPGGAAIIVETLGTGGTEPKPPTPALGEYYAVLENEHRFERHAIRTDYRFESVEEAERLVRFFFGDELADRVVRERLVVLPECTGVWIARYPRSG